MKKFITIVLLSLIMQGVNAQTWVAKSDFTGDAFSTGVSFVIGDYAYVGLGLGGNSYTEKNDFWRYNPQTDTWSAVAPLPGVGRLGAAAVVLNGKAYVGLGSNKNKTAWYSDWYEYDPALNQWTAKTPCINGGRSYCTYFGFEDLGKAYIMMGSKSVINKEQSEVLTYQPATDTWEVVTGIVPPEGGTPVFGASSFLWNGKGYMTGGKGGSQIYPAFYEFDPHKTSNHWVRKTPLSASMSIRNTSFALGGKAYACYGSDYKNVVVYDSLANTTQVVANPLNFTQYDLEYPLSFVINNTAYFLLGEFSTSFNKKVFALTIPVSTQNPTDLIDLTLAPNPSNGVCHLRGSHVKSGEVTLQLMDTNGRILRTSRHTLPVGTFDLPIERGDLPTGIYILTIQTTEGTQTQKVVFE
jgi:Secretion system C-terminal sorting domain/Galactose oxidase, central domain